jgi:hypothetical protein
MGYYENNENNYEYDIDNPAISQSFVDKVFFLLHLIEWCKIVKRYLLCSAEQGPVGCCCLELSTLKAGLNETNGYFDLNYWISA